MSAMQQMLLGVGADGLRLVGVATPIILNGTSATTITIPVPSFARPGDRLVVSYASTTFSMPGSQSGWNIWVQNTSGVTSEILSRLLPATPPSSYSVTVNNFGSVDVAALIMVFRKAGLDVPPGPIGGSVTGPGTATRGAATVAGGLSIDFAWTRDGATASITPPAGRNLISSGSANTATVKAFLKKTVAGTDGPANFVFANSSEQLIVYPLLLIET